jgi:hypothetical protein
METAEAFDSLGRVGGKRAAFPQKVACLGLCSVTHITFCVDLAEMRILV